MNPVDKHLSEQAEKFAPRNEPYKDSVERLSWENIRRGERHAFLAGAQAAKEIYLLQGRIDGLYEGLKTQGTHGPYTKFLDKQLQEAKSQLEKLLTEKEQG